MIRKLVCGALGVLAFPFAALALLCLLPVLGAAYARARISRPRAPRR